MIYPLKNQCNEEEPKPSQEENRKTEKPISDGVPAGKCRCIGAGENSNRYRDRCLGDPLIGATVLVQGTSNGVITDIDGRYSIQATPENTLDFSYVGMVKQAVKVGSQSVINVQMKDDSQMLAETVVIGYGSAKKRDLTAPSPTLKATKSPTSRWSTPYPHCKERLPACR